jgi:hypothetical protein
LATDAIFVSLQRDWGRVAAIRADGTRDAPPRDTDQGGIGVAVANCCADAR